MRRRDTLTSSQFPGVKVPSLSWPPAPRSGALQLARDMRIRLAIRCPTEAIDVVELAERLHDALTRRRHVRRRQQAAARRPWRAAPSGFLPCLAPGWWVSL
eukprot:8697752-Pyramimonas_sp.AAC.1